MCSKREAVDDMIVDCEQCGKRLHVFWQDTVGKVIISGSPDHSRKNFVLFHTTLTDTSHSSFLEGFLNWDKHRYW